MSYWKCMPVAFEPEVTLVNWRIMETERGERHFVGDHVANASGRVSSAIVTFDIERLVGVTTSGRVYSLDGPPSKSSEADYVWSVWRVRNEVSGYADVTDIATRRIDDCGTSDAAQKQQRVLKRTA
jgi:hypothetical protein